MLGLGSSALPSTLAALLFPLTSFSPQSHVLAFSLLLVGDIIIPGIFLALALRLDYSLATRRASPNKPILPSSSFPKPYFITNLVAYIAGLVTTIVVMHTFKAAQPALLYLSPACGAFPFASAVQITTDAD
jgi:minor histocompatibility antigen H13